MKNYFVYLLESLRTFRFYIGQTDNIQARLIKHNSGDVRSTKYGAPWELVGFVSVPSRSEALKLEEELKSHSDKKLKFIRKFRSEFSWGNKPG